jgi:hypothetical protein
MEKEKQIVLVRERTSQSIIQDFVSYAAVLFSFWFNYKFIGGNDALDIILFIVFFGLAARNLGEYKVFAEKVNKSSQDEENRVV